MKTAQKLILMALAICLPPMATASDKCNSPAADSECIRLRPGQISAPSSAAGASASVLYENTASTAWSSGFVKHSNPVEFHSTTITLSEARVLLFGYDILHGSVIMASDRAGCASDLVVSVNGVAVWNTTLEDHIGTEGIGGDTVSSYGCNSPGARYISSGPINYTKNEAQKAIPLPAGTHVISWGVRERSAGAAQYPPKLATRTLTIIGM